MSVWPVKLNRDSGNGGLVIEWSDGREQRITVRTLRDHCPCAGCRTPEKKSGAAGLTILSPAETRPLEILSMSPVGNYAYHIQFSDSHNTGIFTFDLLRSLS